MCGGEGRCIQSFVGKSVGRKHLEDPGLDGRMILKWIFEKLNGDTDWSDLAHNRDRQRAVVNAVMNCIKYGEFLKKVSASKS
jgi:hypothetical protein